MPNASAGSRSLPSYQRRRRPFRCAGSPVSTTRAVLSTFHQSPPMRHDTLPSSAIWPCVFSTHCCVTCADCGACALSWYTEIKCTWSFLAQHTIPTPSRAQKCRRINTCMGLLTSTHCGAATAPDMVHTSRTPHSRQPFAIIAHCTAGKPSLGIQCSFSSMTAASVSRALNNASVLPPMVIVHMLWRTLEPKWRRYNLAPVAPCTAAWRSWIACLVNAPLEGVAAAVEASPPSPHALTLRMA